MVYKRAPIYKINDFKDSQTYEAQVAEHLPRNKVDNTKSPDRLDWWVPGYYLDLKTKTQPLNKRWHLIDAPHEDIFVLDELALRKMMLHFPGAFFHLWDIPGDRHFLAPAWELAVCERKRIMRDKRAKVLVDMTQFHPAEKEGIHDLATSLLAGLPWKTSSSVGRLEIPQV